MEPVILRARLESALMTTCRELAKILPKEQEREMVRKCEEAFGKKFAEVLSTAQVSPPVPSEVSIPRELPTVEVPRTAIEKSPALEPFEAKPYQAPVEGL